MTELLGFTTRKIEEKFVRGKQIILRFEHVACYGLGVRQGVGECIQFLTIHFQLCYYMQYLTEYLSKINDFQQLSFHILVVN